MNSGNFKTSKNSQAVNFDQVPVIDISVFRRTIIDHVKTGFRLGSMFGVPEKYFTENSEYLRIIAVLLNEDNIYLTSTAVENSYESITPDCVQARLFEREIWEQYNVIPKGHPFLKPVRFQKPYKDFSVDLESRLIGSTNFFQFNGVETHEVAVGPVHAGVIEPGHFRFQCHGENVYNLEISLGYQHRGIEAALIDGPNNKTIHFIETLAGDTTAGHTTAYSQIYEALTATNVSKKSLIIRSIALELERIANHVGDLGALAGDVGYLPTNSFCGRIRGDFLNLTADLCGNRFSRGLIIPGGVDYDLDHNLSLELSNKIRKLIIDTEGAISLLWKSNSVLARFEGTGIVTDKMCKDLGLVGPVVRACNIKQDIRNDMPFGIYRVKKIPVSVNDGGDVFSRAYVRWLEIKNSADHVLHLLENMSDGNYHLKTSEIQSDKIAVSLVEGWRGEICHTVITNGAGKFLKYKIVDPSFHNWIGLAIALRGEEIADFPLCNKSFNLSYCGHDL